MGQWLGGDIAKNDFLLYNLLVDYLLDHLLSDLRNLKHKM
jgi:hypothetical protein